MVPSPSKEFGAIQDGVLGAHEFLNLDRLNREVTDSDLADYQAWRVEGVVDATHALVRVSDDFGVQRVELRRILENAGD